MKSATPNWDEVARALFRVRDLHVCLDHRAADLPGHHARFTLAIESGSACCVSIDRLVVDFTNGNRGHGMRNGCDRTGQKHDLGCWLGILVLTVNLVGDLTNALLRHDVRTLIGMPIAGAMMVYLYGYAGTRSSR